MFKFQKDISKLNNVKRPTLITSKTIYAKVIEAEVVEAQPNNIKKNLYTIRQNLLALTEVLYTIQPNLYFRLNFTKENPDIPYTKLDDRVISVSRKIINCIINTANNSISKRIADSVEGNRSYDLYKDDVGWRIGYMNAMGDLAKKLLGLIISSVCVTLFSQLNNFILELANGISKIRGELNIILVKICINPGVVLKAVVIRFIHYYIYELIWIFEKMPWCWLTYKHADRDEYRTINLYQDLFGSIVDQVFYPKYSASHLLNENNRHYAESLSQCEIAMSSVSYFVSVKWGFGGTACKDISVKSPISGRIYGLKTEEIFNVFGKNKSNEHTAAVKSCVECPGNCDDFSNGSINPLNQLKYEMDTQAIIDSINNNIIEYDEDLGLIDPEVFKDLDSFLKELKNQVDSDSNQLDTYETISENYLPTDMNDKFTNDIIKMELAMKEVSRILSNSINLNFLDMANEITNPRPFNLTKKSLEKKLLLFIKQEEYLLEKISKYQNELVQMRIRLELDRDKSFNEYSTILKNDMKVQRFEIGTVERTVEQLILELENIRKDIEKCKKEIKTAGDDVPVIDSELLQQRQVYNSIIIFVFDMICCTISMLLNLLSKQYDRDPEKFKKIIDSMWYKILTNSSDAYNSYKETSAYAGVELAIMCLQFLFDTCVNTYSAIRGTSEYEGKVHIDFDLGRMLTSAMANSAFAAADTFITVVDEMLFSSLTLMTDVARWVPHAIPKSKLADYEGMEIKDYFPSFNELAKFVPAVDETDEPLYQLVAYPDNNKKHDYVFLNNKDKYHYGLYMYYVPKGENVLDDLLGMLYGGKCLSLNFMFDYVLSFVSNFHKTMLIYKILLEYNPKIDIYSVYSYESMAKTHSSNAFLNMFRLILLNFDFFIKFCNLEDQVELNDELRSIIDDETKTTTRPMFISPHALTTSSADIGDPTKDFNGEEYMKKLTMYLNLPIEPAQKIMGGHLSEMSGLIMSKINADIVIDDNIVKTVNK